MCWWSGAGAREAFSGLSLGGQVPKMMPGSWGRSSTDQHKGTSRHGKEHAEFRCRGKAPPGMDGTAFGLVLVCPCRWSPQLVSPVLPSLALTHPCLFLKHGVVLPPQNACLIPQRDKGILPICQSPVSHPSWSRSMWPSHAAQGRPGLPAVGRSTA